MLYSTCTACPCNPVSVVACRLLAQQSAKLLLQLSTCHACYHLQVPPQPAALQPAVPRPPGRCYAHTSCRSPTVHSTSLATGLSQAAMIEHARCVSGSTAPCAEQLEQRVSVCLRAMLISHSQRPPGSSEHSTVDLQLGMRLCANLSRHVSAESSFNRTKAAISTVLVPAYHCETI